MPKYGQFGWWLPSIEPVADILSAHPFLPVLSPENAEYLPDAKRREPRVERGQSGSGPDSDSQAASKARYCG